MRIDHVVHWVEDPLRAVEFYEAVLGMPGVAVEEFRRGEVPFPSARVDEHSIIDLMPKSTADDVDALHGWPGSSGNPVNHLCLALDEADYLALRERVEARGVEVLITMTGTSGARGDSKEAIYFTDPDGNVIEVRHY